MRKQSNQRQTAENIENMQRKCKSAMTRKKWQVGVGKFTLSGDPVVGQKLDTMTRVGRESTKPCAFPLPPRREKNQPLVGKAEGELGGQQ